MKFELGSYQDGCSSFDTPGSAAHRTRCRLNESQKCFGDIRERPYLIEHGGYLSKFNRLSLPTTAPLPPPPSPIPPPSLPAFPTPWCIGPDGDIWVASDVAKIDGFWTHTCQAPRIVAWRNEWPEGLAQMIVDAVNARHSQ